MSDRHLVIILATVLSSVVIIAVSSRYVDRMSRILQNVLFVIGLLSAIGTVFLQFGIIFLGCFAFLLPWDIDPPTDVARWQRRLNSFFDSGEPPFGPLLNVAVGIALLLALACAIPLAKDLFAARPLATRVQRVVLFYTVNLFSLPLLGLGLFLGAIMPSIWLQQDQRASYVDLLPGGLLFLLTVAVIPWFHRTTSTISDLVPHPNPELQ